VFPYIKIWFYGTLALDKKAVWKLCAIKVVFVICDVCVLTMIVVDIDMIVHDNDKVCYTSYLIKSSLVYY
jgi:hypothetical protein